MRKLAEKMRDNTKQMRKNAAAPLVGHESILLGGLHVEDVAMCDRVIDSPGGVVDLSDGGALCRLNGPLGALIDPAALRAYQGFAIRVHDRLDSSLLEPLSELRHKQLRSTIMGWRNCDEGRGDQCNSQPWTCARRHARHLQA